MQLTIKAHKQRVINLINKIPKGIKINLIGHSYGVDSAAKIVEKLLTRIHTLITIDPVGGDTQNIKTLKDKTKLWINVTAVGEGISIGDFWAGVSLSAWNDKPKNYAN
jgi:pimeloyl-ACP methyl ester carboxylesterase